ncbi:MAG: hypothetical protein A2390_02940 [Candidatus Liptonbacteria bacterium RIFOXYB1_FULL_36_10]|uniref:Cell division protein FtsX n=2 Tax=Candidatus Liptoniibacteriota TaxID=1817909 RepID=A0A1G2CS94_9BACT|nr:MAG: hypothetical protein A2390_02940 [Candidatus Liptonbacteria bacterium RIFOXYB1_FULL_36_10]OGZ04561.1 MAG: hypothetical protein A2604_01450 [Candidatus Liptonbacteria bacterium RIFOXYD1_FULL_36_11]
MVTTFFRLIKYGLQNFLRNGWLSVATLVVMTLALSSFLFLMIFRFTTGAVLTTLEDKIDISVYFKTSAPEDEILRLKKSLEDLSDVKKVNYISRADALDDFKNKHKNDAAGQALNELKDNPFSASLNVKAKDSEKYAIIASYLENEGFKQIIEKVTYAQNQLVIERMNSIINTVNKSGFALALIFAITAILVAFNTIWLAMYSNREEIGIMRLVGASNTFIRGPFVVEGVVYGLLAAFLSLILAIPVVLTANPWVQKVVPDISLRSYFVSNFFGLAGYQILFGILLGSVSSFIAIRRYLKV